MKARRSFLMISIVMVFALQTLLHAGVPEWYKYYNKGLKAMEIGNYGLAAENFLKALEFKPKDKKKTRAYGAVFIEYFANRELGICYYYLGDMKNAEKYLFKSMNMAPSNRAKNYIKKIKKGQKPPVISKPKVLTPPPATQETKAAATIKPPKRESKIGERMSIAVLQFESKGLGQEYGEVDLMDKLITAFVNSERFRVIERAQLEKILEEQKLGLSGILDASTAAQIGRGIGVDAVVVGSVTRTGDAVSIDARIIDTETATIIVAQDAYSNRISIQNINQMIGTLADKIEKDLPVIHGVVINVTGDQITLDIGRQSGLKKGMKCIIYEEGENIVHPISGEVIGKMITEKCEIQVKEVFDGYSIGTITKTKKGIPKKLDKVITK